MHAYLSSEHGDQAGIGAHVEHHITIVNADAVLQIHLLYILLVIQEKHLCWRRSVPDAEPVG